MHPARNDIGAYIDTAQESIRPQNSDLTADINGESVDRTGYDSGVLTAQIGAATGSPTAQSFVIIVEESADDSTWTAVSDATITLDADNEIAELDLDLREREQYIRATLDVSEGGFTGGSTPANDLFAHFTLGGSYDLPV